MKNGDADCGFLHVILALMLYDLNVVFSICWFHISLKFVTFCSALCIFCCELFLRLQDSLERCYLLLKFFPIS